MEESLQREYRRRQTLASDSYARWRVRSGRLVLALVVVALVFAIWLWRAVRNEASLWPLLALVLLAALLAAVLLHVRGRAERAARLSLLYERGAARLEGTGMQSGQTGEQFARPAHLYAADLNILGPDSLFGMLATTRTMLGQRSLAALLLEPAEPATARQRQKAVQELAPLLDLREQVAVLGRSEFEQVPADAFDRWLDASVAPLPAWGPALLAVSGLWLAALAVGWIVHTEGQTLLRNIAALLAVQGALVLPLRERVRAELERAQRLAGQSVLLRSGLELLRGAELQSERLRALQTICANAEGALVALERHTLLAEQRGKDWFYAPGLLLCVGTHAALGLQRWKRAHAKALRGWAAAWGEFEALLALATYAAEHERNVYPEIFDPSPRDETPAIFAALGLRHPLLRREVAVPNDVELGGWQSEKSQMLVISGSNMAGKSTLLRTLGVNVVLALAGAPIPADSARMTALQVVASLAVGDSLAEGRSKFLAEVERLRDMVALARQRGGRVLFLIDEIFSGTNSADRRIAAEAVSRVLLATGAVGAISTHDLSLAQMGDTPGVQNVHMASPDADDPLRFDYLLKPGVNQTTNALAIVRMLGLV